jgi:hypothetical protein
LRLSQHSFFAGIVLRGSLEDIQKAKKYITQKTNLEIIYQHNDIRYLTIQIAPQNNNNTNNNTNPTNNPPNPTETETNSNLLCTP